MDSLYGQDAELALLRSLIPCVHGHTMFDVGAEQGSLAEEMLRGGVEKLYAFDPHPVNAGALRARFADDRRVIVNEYALSETNGSGELHVSSRPDGTPLAFGHTLLKREDTSEIAWRETVPVTRRSLESLINAGEVPAKVGILKIDTEGHDLAVLKGMGKLEADVVMIEHWTDLPDGLGVCPWATQDIVEVLGGRGFSHFAFVLHSGEFVTFKWDDGEAERGAMGNLVFFHDRVLATVLPQVLTCASHLTEMTVRRAQEYMDSATDRSTLIDELKRAADDRLGLVEELKQAAEDRLALVEQLSAVAQERLEALETSAAELRARESELERLRHPTTRLGPGA